jgi:hypothetical protein
MLRQTVAASSGVTGFIALIAGASTTAFLKRSPDSATPDDVRRFQLYLVETGMSICNRNRIMTGVKFLFRVTLRRPDLVAEIYHLREPQKIPLVMSQDETRRLLAVASSLKLRVLLSLAYGCGLRAGEVVKRACCRVRAPAAADACSDLRARLPAQASSRRRQDRSGWTPHDAVTADPPPERHQLFAPDSRPASPPLASAR